MMSCFSLPSLVVLGQTVIEIFDREILGKFPQFSQNLPCEFPPKFDKMYGVGTSTKPASMNDIVRAVSGKNLRSYSASVLYSGNPRL